MARETRSHARVACEGPRPTGLGRVFGERRGTENPSPYGVMVEGCMARETRSHARVACEGPRPTVSGRLFGERRGTGPRPTVLGRLFGERRGTENPSPYAFMRIQYTAR